PALLFLVKSIDKSFLHEFINNRVIVKIRNGRLRFPFPIQYSLYDSRVYSRHLFEIFSRKLQSLVDGLAFHILSEHFTGHLIVRVQRGDTCDVRSQKSFDGFWLALIRRLLHLNQILRKRNTELSQFCHQACVGSRFHRYDRSRNEASSKGGLNLPGSSQWLELRFVLKIVFLQDEFS